jgi:hypothetical protein
MSYHVFIVHHLLNQNEKLFILFIGICLKQINILLTVKYCSVASTGIIKFKFNCFLKIEIKLFPVQTYIYNDKIDTMSYPK